MKFSQKFVVWILFPVHHWIILCQEENCKQQLVLEVTEIQALSMDPLTQVWDENIDESDLVYSETWAQVDPENQALLVPIQLYGHVLSQELLWFRKHI
jgi:hypothetical protein